MRLKRLFILTVEFLRFALPTLLIAAVTRPRRSSAAGPPRILVTRLDQIGDFMMTTPLLRELRRNFPESRITLVVRGNAAPLAIACPYVDRVLVLKSFPGRRAFRSYLRYLLGFAGYIDYLKDFAQNNLVGATDIAIQPRWDVDSEFASLITWLSGAARTIGYTEETSPEKARCNAGHDRLFTDVLARGFSLHEADRNLAIVSHLGGIVANRAAEAWWTPEDQARANRFLDKVRTSRRDHLIAFGIGASIAKRHWPFYGELIEMMAQTMQFTPILLAGPGEEYLVHAITAKVPTAIVLQNVPLGAVAAILSECALFIGNDSGPMHLAAAVGLPVVEISCHPREGDPTHVNSPSRSGPLATHTRIIRPSAPLEGCKTGCAKDTPHCITAISSAEVLAAAMALIEYSAVIAVPESLVDVVF